MGNESPGELVFKALCLLALISNVAPPPVGNMTSVFFSGRMWVRIGPASLIIGNRVNTVKHIAHTWHVVSTK